MTRTDAPRPAGRGAAGARPVLLLLALLALPAHAAGPPDPIVYEGGKGLVERAVTAANDLIAAEAAGTAPTTEQLCDLSQRISLAAAAATRMERVCTANRAGSSCRMELVRDAEAGAAVLRMQGYFHSRMERAGHGPSFSGHIKACGK